MLNGVDVSVYQGDINYDILKTELDFVIIKATEGNGLTDPKFARNKAEAVRVGLPHGYYHFARPNLGNTPQAEADYFLSVCQPGIGTILFLDFEVVYQDNVNWAKAWLDHVSAKLGGYKPVFYSYSAMINTGDWSPIVNANYGLWVANYNGNTDPIPAPWANTAFKQWESTEKLNGIIGPVDADVFYGDLKAFDAYSYHPQALPPVTPAPTPTTNDYSTKQAIIDVYTVFCNAKPSDDEVNYKLNEIKNGKSMVDIFSEYPGDSRFQALFVEPKTKQLQVEVNTLTAELDTANGQNEALNTKVNDLTSVNNQQVQLITGLRQQLLDCAEQTKVDLRTWLGKLLYSLARQAG